MKEIVIDPEDVIYELYVMDGSLYIEQSMKIPIDALITVTDTPYARIRVTVNGDNRITEYSSRRSTNEMD